MDFSPFEIIAGFLLSHVVHLSAQLQTFCHDEEWFFALYEVSNYAA
jgi:hypothetical protein